MITKAQILARMALYRVEGGGIGSWLTPDTPSAVFDRLGRLDDEPLSASQLNQLLVLSHEAPVTDGFFRYYWLTAGLKHPYSSRTWPTFQDKWDEITAITSLDHLAWGLHRLYVDGLLYFGNVRTAFRKLRDFSYGELCAYFDAQRIDTDAIKRRGPALPLRMLEKDKRYLVAERACKSYGEHPKITSNLWNALIRAFDAYSAVQGSQAVTISALLNDHLPADLVTSKKNLVFSASEILNESVRSHEDIRSHYQRVAARFEDARRDALENTNNYLSMLTDLDVYVATSMRDPEDFVQMAETCSAIFSDGRLKAMNIRFFDPTLSAADGHEDKGLIECLMVKCAKALVYCGGKTDSYGKDAEAAMALSLGRPVIFYCEDATKAQFYREVHPLSRLIKFENGVAVGAMATDKVEEVAELLVRTLENQMVYKLERASSGALRLREDLTGCVVRFQTSNTLLRETFWNYYHRDRDRRVVVDELASKTAVDSEKVVTLPTRHPKQQPLPLPQTEQPLPMAARELSAATAAGEVKVGKAATATTPRTESTLPISLEEIFDGISSVKCGQATGRKRFTVFSQWMEEENQDLTQAIKLLRFINGTLTAHKVSGSYIYKKADLTRWFTEMSNGQAEGSKQ